MEENRVIIKKDNISITRVESKCISCGACKSYCKFNQGVDGYYDLNNPICINCGQCINVCPMYALDQKKNYKEVEKIINDKEKIVVFQTAPSVRVALGEGFNFEYGEFLEGKMVSALKKLGADYVFDTTFGADLTIMEEASELLERVVNNEKLPMFTSCCPGWVSFAENFYPELLNNLSTCKSPILMQGTMIKTYFSKVSNIDPKNIVNVAITPCTAKKFEIVREEMNSSGKFLGDESIRDIDYVITTNELIEWIKDKKIDFNSLEDSKYDSIMGKGSGAGLIFGATGGVMEAALRTANYLYTNSEDVSLLEYVPVRGLNGIKESKIKLGDRELNIAVVTGTGNFRKFMDKIKEENLHYDFVEVMACVGGCAAGGGQPRYDQTYQKDIKMKRIEALYNNDKSLKIRNSYENKDIVKLYQDFLKNPLSDYSRKLLHTKYKKVNNKEKIVN